MNEKTARVAELEEQIRRLQAELDAACSRESAEESDTTTGDDITTGGGAHVEGNVDTQGGDFVGRDFHKSIHHYHGNGADNPQRAEAVYRDRLAERCNILPMRSIDPAPGASTGRQKPLSLARVYIELDTRRSAPVESIEAALDAARRGDVRRFHAEDSPAERSREDHYQPLAALEAVILNRQLVLLGEPGSGKTTFVDHLAYALARQDWECLPQWPEQERNALPILVRLRDFHAWLGALPELPGKAAPHLLWQFIEHDLQTHNLDAAGPLLKEAVNTGRAVILLDGLDEVPAEDEPLLQRVKDCVAAFLKHHGNGRQLITCRVLSYQEPQWRLATDLPDFELARFDPPKIERFVTAWYDEISAKWRLPASRVTRR